MRLHPAFRRDQEGCHGRSDRRFPHRDQRKHRRSGRRPVEAGAHAGRPGDAVADLPPGPHDQGHLRIPRPAAAGTGGARGRECAGQGTRRRADRDARYRDRGPDGVGPDQGDRRRSGGHRQRTGGRRWRTHRGAERGGSGRGAEAGRSRRSGRAGARGGACARAACRAGRGAPAPPPHRLRSRPRRTRRQANRSPPTRPSASPSMCWKT